MTIPPTLSLNEVQILTALRSFLLTSVISGTEVVKGQVNRVPEPNSENFIVFWPLRYDRLATNLTTYDDVDIVGSIAGTILTVTEVGHGELEPGVTLAGTGLGTILVDTVIAAQLSGSVGGTGTYSVSKAQTVALSTIYAGRRLDLAPMRTVVQLDVHGPRSADNCFMIETLFRSEVAEDSFVASGYAVVPLYADAARQVPFVNAEQAYEDRWVIEAAMQINPVTGTPMQFADEIEVGLIEVDTTYPP